jgi:hypothetical protein
MRRAGLWIILPVLAAVSCGGGGGGGNSDGNQPTPVRTTTPAATSTPVPTVSLSLALSATTDLAGASFTVGYEAGRIALLGSGAQAQCRLGSNDTLALNDDDAGSLRVALVPADPLHRQTLVLPTTLTCDFAANGGSVTVDDLRISGKKIGVIDTSMVVVAGDAARLDVH